MFKLIMLSENAHIVYISKVDLCSSFSSAFSYAVEVIAAQFNDDDFHRCCCCPKCVDYMFSPTICLPIKVLIISRTCLNSMMLYLSISSLFTLLHYNYHSITAGIYFEG